MRVLYDHQIFVAQKFGGINRYFEELMQAGEGMHVERIHPGLLDQGGARQDLVSRSLGYLKRKTGLEKSTSVPKLPAEVRGMFAKGDFDVFHPTYYSPYFLELTSKPFVLTVFDMIHEVYKEFFSQADTTTHNKFLLCKKADRIITISKKTKEDLLDIFGIPSEKVHPISLASDFDTVRPSQPKNIEGLERYILFVGTRWIYKNFYFPLIALAEILKNDKQLQVLCTGHPFSKEELQFFKDLGIGGQMRHIYLENDAELAWVYRNAALFIFPSLYEGFGLPLLEAFASDCPVISSNRGSLVEVGGDAALYFDPKDKGQIQDAAYKVLNNQEIRSDLVSKGREQFKKFSWDRCRTETLSIYELVK